MKYLKLLAFAVILLLASCNGCNKNKSREKPDVSNINAQAQIIRFDQDLKKAQTEEFSTWQNMMRAKYADFYDFYLSQFIIGPRPPGDTANINEDAVKRFLADKYISSIQDSINVRFKDTKQAEEDLTFLFKYITYYFPKFHAPQVITFNSAYSAGVSPFGSDKFAVGLDMFLGADNKDYDSAGVYGYLRHKMQPQWIPRYTAEALYDANFAPMGAGEETLIESLVERGKQMYFISYVLPDAPDSLIYGYTKAQTDWCVQNEKDIWKFFNDKDLLYKSAAMDKARYLGEGPTSAGMPKEAPGNIGNFVGLQIVNQFMANEGKSIPLADLILKYDAKTILNKAKYRPGK